MRKLLLLISTLFAFVCSVNSQITFPGNIKVPNGASYPSHIDSLGYGGFRALDRLTERDSITTLRRKFGMLVYVRQTDSTYILKSSTLDNDNWVAFRQGSVDLTNYYTKTEVDAAVGPKIDSTRIKQWVSWNYQPIGNYLLSSNNLLDVSDANAALENLGVYALVDPKWDSVRAKNFIAWNYQPIGNYLTANQNITISGAASGSGNTAITLTLSNTGVTAGTYGNATTIPVFTVGADGRITGVSTATINPVSTLAALTDVNITTVTNGQLLRYNSTSGKWENWSANYILNDGTGATGTWGINISGNSSTVTNGVYTTTFNSLGDARYLLLSGGTLTGQTSIVYSMGTSDALIIRYSNTTQGIGIGYNTIATNGTSANQSLFLQAQGTGIVNIVSNAQVNGTLNVIQDVSTSGIQTNAYKTTTGYTSIALNPTTADIILNYALFGTRVHTSQGIRASGTGFDANSAEIQLINTTASTGKTFVLNSSDAGFFQIADKTAGSLTRLLIDASGNSTFYGPVTATQFNGSGATFTGNVGIGTTSPNFKLEVNQAASTTPAFNIASSQRASIGLGLNSGITTGWIIGRDIGNNGTNDFYITNVATGVANFQISSTGAATFSGSINGTSLSMSGAGSASIDGILTITNSNAKNELFFSGNDFTNIYSNTTSGIQFGISNAASTGALEFLTANAVRLTIASSGAATFSSSVAATQLNLSGNINLDKSSGDAAILTNNPNGSTTYWRLSDNAFIRGYFGLNGLTGGSNADLAIYSNTGGIRLFANSALALNISSTGAATFSSSVTAASFTSSSTANNTVLTSTGTASGQISRIQFYQASGSADARSGVLEWYDGATFKGDIRLLKAGGIEIRNPSDVAIFQLSSAGAITAASFNGSGAGLTNIPWASITGAPSFLTGNQTITLSGDATGSGATSIALTLANSGVTAGTYTKVTVDAKGRVTTGAQVQWADIGGTVPTWNQNTTGNAATATNATQWAGSPANFSVTAPNSQITGTIVYNSTNGRFEYTNFSNFSAWILQGLGSYAYRSSGLAELSGATFTGDLTASRVFSQGTAPLVQSYSPTGTEAVLRAYSGSHYWDWSVTGSDLSFKYNGASRVSFTNTGATTFTGSVDFRTPYTFFGSQQGYVYVLEDQINSYFSTDADASLNFNYYGYNAGFTRFRNFSVYDGKGQLAFAITGSTKAATFTSSVSAASFIRSGGTSSQVHRADGGTWGMNQDLLTSSNVTFNQVTAGAFYESPSDIRKKEVIQRWVTSSSDGIDAIQYYLKDDPSRRLYIGYEAQQVMKTIPNAVETFEDKTMPDGKTYSVSVHQVLVQKVALLEARIAELEKLLINKKN